MERQSFEAAGAILMYLPAYSPDFNPIEMAFSKFKALLRAAAARTIADLGAAIRIALDASRQVNATIISPQLDMMHSDRKML